MHSIRSAGRPFPFTALGSAHGSSSDPLRFSLNLNPPDSSSAPSLWAPYLSPPMSGSPSPENRFDPLRGERRRKRSSSPTSTTAYGVVQPALSYPDHAARIPGPEILLSDSRRLSGGQSGMSILTLPAIDDPQLRPTLAPGALLPPRTNTLPPRSTRRAKAHVASACVNCKESSCVDVTHKRRGRPPLKAEEGPLRTYEPTFTNPGTSRPPPQNTSPISGLYTHRRTSSSREIRPSTELQLTRTSTEFGSEYGRPRLSPAISNSHMWAQPTSSRAMPTSPLISSCFPGQFAVPGVSAQPSGNHPQLFSPERRSSTYTRDYGDVSRPIHQFSGESPLSNQSPHRYQPPPPPPPPPGSSYFSGPVSPHGPLSSPTLSGSGRARSYPFSGPGQPQIRLPPLKPPATGTESEFPHSSHQGPSSAPVPPWRPSLPSGRPHTSRDDFVQEPEDSRPAPKQPPFQPAEPYVSGPSTRGLLDSYHPPPLPPQLQPRQQQQQGNLPVSAASRPADLEKSGHLEEKEKEPESRPAKRQKMALGDMVND
ncbi:hypothetical protein FQN51_001113 [Onygenales sp. PD_10]|nr:hypothetical protein FQN51_001113 [Onygenales sp. PD_10]